MIESNSLKLCFLAKKANSTANQQQKKYFCFSKKKKYQNKNDQGCQQTNVLLFYLLHPISIMLTLHRLVPIGEKAILNFVHNCHCWLFLVQFHYQRKYLLRLLCYHRSIFLLMCCIRLWHHVHVAILWRLGLWVPRVMMRIQMWR